MERRHVTLHSEGPGVLAYGHYGRPMLAFPSQQGYCHDYENMGMVDAIAGLIDAGRVKLYCVDTIDGQTWHDGSLPLEERARRHGAYEEWIVGAVVPYILDDCGGPQEHHRHRAELRRLPRGELRAQARRPVPARDLPQRHLRRRRRSAGASAATPSTSTTRRLRPAPGRRPPRLAARPASTC